MDKSQAGSQCELTENPNDKDPFRKKQQRAVSKYEPPIIPDKPSAEQLRQWLNLARGAYDLYGTRGKLPYKGVMMPAVAVKLAGILKDKRKHARV